VGPSVAGPERRRPGAAPRACATRLGVATTMRRKERERAAW